MTELRGEICWIWFDLLWFILPWLTWLARFAPYFPSPADTWQPANSRISCTTIKVSTSFQWGWWVPPLLEIAGVLPWCKNGGVPPLTINVGGPPQMKDCRRATQTIQQTLFNQQIQGSGAPLLKFQPVFIEDEACRHHGKMQACRLDAKWRRAAHNNKCRRAAINENCRRAA